MGLRRESATMPSHDGDLGSDRRGADAAGDRHAGVGAAAVVRLARPRRRRTPLRLGFGYLGTSALDEAVLLGALVETISSDRVDLVDLARAGGLVRYRAARDGYLIFEARSGIDNRFRFEAARFWCDVAPVLERGYEDVLAELDR